MMYHLNLDRTENRLLEARKAIEVAKTIDPNNPELIFADGIYSYINNDYDIALRKYIAVEDKVFNNAELNLFMGGLYRRQMNLGKAIEYFLHAAEDDPRNKLFQLELGETNTILRNYVEAERSFDKYILLGGNFETALVDDVLLYLLWESGNIKSRKALEERLTVLGEKKSISTIHRAVQVEIIDRNYDDALTIVTTELSENLDHQFRYKPVSLYLAEIYHYQGIKELAAFYYDSARIHLETIILSSPEDSRLYSTLGIAYAGLGRKKEAIEAGLTGKSLMPTEKDFYRGIFRLEDLARIYTMVGEYNLALEQLEQLLSMPSLVSVCLLQKDPVWEPLWNLPEFKQLIKKYSDD
jgi:tetratricopeptide (TPR) repeat protein